MKKNLAKKSLKNQSKKVSKNVPRGTLKKTTKKRTEIMSTENLCWGIRIRDTEEMTVSADQEAQIVRLWYGLKPAAKKNAQIVYKRPEQGDWHPPGPLLGRWVCAAFVKLLWPVGVHEVSCHSLPDMDTLEMAVRLTRKAIK